MVGFFSVFGEFPEVVFFDVVAVCSDELLAVDWYDFDVVSPSVSAVTVCGDGIVLVPRFD